MEPGTVAVRYADSPAVKAEIIKVRETNNRIITDIINKRVNNGLVGQARTEAIRKLMEEFKPILDELDAINDRFAHSIQNGMDGLQAADQAGARR